MKQVRDQSKCYFFAIIAEIIQINENDKVQIRFQKNKENKINDHQTIEKILNYISTKNEQNRFR